MLDSFLMYVNMFSDILVAQLSVGNILVLTGATIMGIIVGAIPGLTATMALALLINLSYGMQFDLAITFLLGVYVGAVMEVVFGDYDKHSRYAICCSNCFGWIPLAKQGKGELAIVQVLLLPFWYVDKHCLSYFTNSTCLCYCLKFGHWEYFLLAVFGIMICGNLSAGKILSKDGWLVLGVSP